MRSGPVFALTLQYTGAYPHALLSVLMLRRHGAVAARAPGEPLSSERVTTVTGSNQMARTSKTHLGMAACLLILIPSALSAQTMAGSIAGTVRDATGGGLPGVEVEDSSPVLIEHVRAAV